MSELWSSFLTNRGGVVHKWTHYFSAYERHFARFKDTSCVVLEIGCFKGGSLQMWKRYFGPHAEIVGIDIEPACKQFEEDQIRIFIGDQADCAFLAKVIEDVGQPDIIIDDGSHVMRHVNASFDFLYPRLARNGVYLVEDLHTAYWDEYGGGFRKEGTFIERSKSLIDSLNVFHSRGAVPVDSFSRSTLSMHFYDSVVVFEKGNHRPTTAPQIGTQPDLPELAVEVLSTEPREHAPEGGNIDAASLSGDRRELRLVGWMPFGPPTPQQRIAVLVNTRVAAARAIRIERPDVARALVNQDLVLSGFELKMQVDKPERDEAVTVSVFATDGADRWTALCGGRRSLPG